MTTKKTKQSLRLLTLLYAIIILVSCTSKTEKTEEDTAPDSMNIEINNEQFQAAQMALGAMTKDTFSKTIRANGHIDVPPKYKASISSFYGGKVKNINLIPGQKVTKNQVLFELENPELIKIQQEYLETKALLTYLKSDFERQQVLAENKVSSQKSFSKAASEYQMAQAKLASLNKQIKLMNLQPENISPENIQSRMLIKATVSGYISHLNISDGYSLNASEKALEIINTDHLHLELNLFEKDIHLIKKGQSITFNTQGNNQKKYSALVHLVNKTMDTKERSIGVHAHIQKIDQNTVFFPGQYIEADINISEKTNWAIPTESIVEVDGKFYILKLLSRNNGIFKFEKVEIKTGDQNGDKTEIINHQDFSPSNQFLVKGSYNLLSE